MLPPIDPHDLLMSPILPLKWNDVKNFPFDKTYSSQSCHGALNAFLQYLTQQNLICCYINQCDLKRQIWKEGKNRFQTEFIFRKTPIVEVKQTQEVKHFKGLHYSVHYTVLSFPVKSPLICKKSRWLTNMMLPSPFPQHWISIEGLQSSSGSEKVQGRSTIEVPVPKAYLLHHNQPPIIDINGLYDSKNEGSAGEPQGLRPVIKERKELAI